MASSLWLFGAVDGKVAVCLQGPGSSFALELHTNIYYDTRAGQSKLMPSIQVCLFV